MKKIITLLALICLPLTAIAEEQVKWIDGIIAVVNDDVITQTELKRQLQSMLQQLRSQKVELPPIETIRQQVLERMVIARLQLQLAEKSGIRIDDTTLDRAVENMAKQNRLSLEQFRNVLEEDGYNFAEFREDMRKEITINRLRQREVDNRIVITEQDIDNYLITQQTQGSNNDEYRLQHILIAVPEGSTPDQIAVVRKQAQQIIDEVRAGSSFTQMAMSKSAGQTALQGGDLGWRKLGQLPTIFADLAVNMAVGDVSDLIRSPSGFHIVQLAEKRSADQQRNIITQTHASHILIQPTGPNNVEAAKTRLERLRHRIINGEDFAELAKTNSDDKGSATEGGSLGWVSPGQMVPEFEEVMDRTDPGQVSEVFQSRYGWHLIQVQERREHDNTDQMKRDAARDAIRQRRVEEEYELWLRRLRDEAFVEIR
jgi:peptidyl-prolyl cis-trans isomerase SurA